MNRGQARGSSQKALGSHRLLFNPYLKEVLGKRAEIAESIDVMSEVIYNAGFEAGKAKSASFEGGESGEREGDNINNILSLIQLLKSNIDTLGDSVYSYNVEQNRSVIHLRIELFIAKFTDFEISVKESMKYPYHLTMDIDGVVFLALTNAQEIVDLKATMPEQWAYIQSKLQVDVA